MHWRGIWEEEGQVWGATPLMSAVKVLLASLSTRSSSYLRSADCTAREPSCTSPIYLRGHQDMCEKAGPMDNTIYLDTSWGLTTLARSSGWGCINMKVLKDPVTTHYITDDVSRTHCRVCINRLWDASTTPVKSRLLFIIHNAKTLSVVFMDQ